MTQTTLSHYLENLQENEDSIVEYRVSTYRSKYNAYWNPKKPKATITFYVSTLWEESESDFNTFVDHLIFLHILERICLERRFQHIKMKNRCKPTCKMAKYAKFIWYCMKKNEKEEEHAKDTK